MVRKKQYSTFCNLCIRFVVWFIDLFTVSPSILNWTEMYFLFFVARIVKSKQWCEMSPCSEGEICGLLFNRSGWTCNKDGGRIKTVTVRHVLNICNIEFIHLVDAMLHHSHHLCFISRSNDLHYQHYSLYNA